MEMENQTSVTHFVLLGFLYSPPVQIFLFCMFSLIYAVTVMGNMVIMAAIRSNNHLHSPMYFFLSHLSFIDLCFSSVTVPKLLLNFCVTRKISYSGCIAQMMFIFLTGTAEAFVLTAMAYDRYTAICKPLYYVRIMNTLFCRQLVVGAWTISSIHALINGLPLLTLEFCGLNMIHHFSCELPSILALSCTDTSQNTRIFFVSSSTVSAPSFLIILVSYIHIISTVLKMNSAEAKRKTLSTCSSHIIIVVLFYISGLFRYFGANIASSTIVEELVSIQYSISTPMLNPIIYSLNSRAVREAIKKLIGFKPLTAHVMQKC